MEQTSDNFEHKGGILTPEQQGLILDEWNKRGVDHPDGPPALNELIKIAFPNVENADGRTKEGRIVKQFLASRDMIARSLHDYVPKEKIELTEEQFLDAIEKTIYQIESWDTTSVRASVGNYLVSLYIIDLIAR